MSTTDLVIWLSAGMLCLAVAFTGAFAFIEIRRPPIQGRLEDIIAAAGDRKRGPCP
ncbi:hypothetical protein [Methylobacterium pseudosasicola]|uniref:Uncharacterized protein n=1 Tax=Methylobacterium pseudosasicola TaxID=582667 RepID=A0A1I4QN55_9HYPH|nr:hypothetical protein [Methylobacterium pseudosasicola]SFM41103.1 hypothetical protein SAMN05192568_103060 [Methylobacterium pseudosasicola]